MQAIDARMHEIRQRFVRGLMLDLDPQQLRNFVTGVADDAQAEARHAA